MKLSIHKNYVQVNKQSNIINKKQQKDQHINCMIVIFNLIMNNNKVKKNNKNKIKNKIKTFKQKRIATYNQTI